MRISILIVMGLLSFNLRAEEKQPVAVKSVKLVVPAQAGRVVENTGKVFTRQVEQRCEAKVVVNGDAPLTVELAVEKGIGAEGYRIEDRQGGGVRITGNDERGLVAGVGKFLRTSRYDKGGFTPGTWRGTSVPQKSRRGIYFATHFNNFYHEAPVDEIQRYVEDLALWGLNELVVWYDAHHFNRPPLSPVPVPPMTPPAKSKFLSDRQKKRLHLRRPHFPRMSQPVKVYKLPIPSHIGLLRPQTVVLEAHHLTDLIFQFHWLR